MDTNHDQLLDLVQLATALRVPIRWLAEQAENGRIPSIDTGKRRLFSRQAAESAILSMARNTPAVIS